MRELIKQGEPFKSKFLLGEVVRINSPAVTNKQGELEVISSFRINRQGELYYCLSNFAVLYGIPSTSLEKVSKEETAMYWIKNVKLEGH